MAKDVRVPMARLTAAPPEQPADAPPATLIPPQGEGAPRRPFSTGSPAATERLNVAVRVPQDPAARVSPSRPVWGRAGGWARCGGEAGRVGAAGVQPRAAPLGYADDLPRMGQLPDGSLDRRRLFLRERGWGGWAKGGGLLREKPADAE